MRIVYVAELDVLITIELAHRLVQEMLLEVALRHPYKQLGHEPANCQLDVNVAVVIARMLTAHKSEKLQKVDPVTRGCRSAACGLLRRGLGQELGNQVD